MEPLGVTVQKLKEYPTGITIPQQIKFARYRDNGFKTPTRKVEIYSTDFAKQGYPPLPDYEEPKLSPKVNQELVKEFPLVLTNNKLRYFLHGQQRAVPDLRRRIPHPFLEINGSTASNLEVTEGEWVYLETPEGKIRLKVSVTDEIAPGIISTQHGWWQGCPKLDLPGYDPFSSLGSNVNLVISNNYMDTISGSISHKANLCKISKIK